MLQEPDSEDMPHVGMIKYNFGPGISKINGMHLIETKSQGIPYMEYDSEYQTMLCAENSKSSVRGTEL